MKPFKIPKDKIFKILSRLFGVFLIFYLVGVAGWALFGPSNGKEKLFDWMGQDEFISRSDLKEKIRPGNYLFVSGFTGSQAGTVCVLYPRGSSVVNANDDPAIAHINAHLSARNIKMEEGDFGLIYWMNDKIKLSIYRLSNDLKIVENTPEAVEQAGELPDNFEPAQCAPLEEAKLFKTLDSRILLGKNKTPKDPDAF